MDPSPDLDDLARLLRSEPVFPFGVDDAPWSYAPVHLALDRGVRRVTLAIDPASEQVDVVLSAAG